MINFENIHKNHKWAFIDGLLCGLVGAWIITLWRSKEPRQKPQNGSGDPSNVYDLQEYAEQR